MKRASIIAAVVAILPLSVAAAAESCDYPSPAVNTPIAAYIKQLQALPQGGQARELGEALNDLVEWAPMSCGDVPPEVTYKSFIIHRVVHGEGPSCRSIRMGIMPPGAKPDHEETPVNCIPAKDGSANGWVCFFR